MEWYIQRGGKAEGRRERRIKERRMEKENGRRLR